MKLNKKPLLEFSAPQAKILEEIYDEKTGERAMRVAVKWSHTEVVNNNRRLYPRSIMEREIERLKPKILLGAVYGASYHPWGDADVDDVSHIWESAAIEDDGSCVGVVKIIPTEPRGRNAQILIKHGGHIGLSTRGRGTTTTKKKVVDGEEIEYEEINDDFELISPGDFVLTPSVPDAGVRRVLESKMNDSKNPPGNEEEKILKKSIDELRAEFPEAFVEIDGEVTRLKESHDTAQAELTTANGRITELEAEVESLRGSLSEKDQEIAKQTDLLTKLGESLKEFGGDSSGTGTGDGSSGQDSGDSSNSTSGSDETLRAENEALKAEMAAMKAENERKEKEKTIQEAVTKALDEAEGMTEDDRPLVEKRIQMPETAEGAAEAVAAARQKLAEDRAELLKGQIRESGLKGQGIIIDPEGSGTRLTADQLAHRFREARKAGFKGTLEQYTKSVLKVRD